MSKSYKIWGGYSTEEKLTGETWIDGKPIYRKVATFTTVGSPTNVPMNISIDVLVKAYCYVREKIKKHWRSIPWLFDEALNGYAGWTGGFYVDSNGNITFQVGKDLGNIDYGHVVIEYTKPDGASEPSVK